MHPLLSKLNRNKNKNKNKNENKRNLLAFGFDDKRIEEDWDITLEGGISDSESVSYRGRTLATCEAGMGAYFTVILGFRLHYPTCFWVPCGLDKIAGVLGLGAGAHAYLDCIFGDNSDDEEIEVSIVHTRIDPTTFYATIGPIAISATPFLDLDVRQIIFSLYN